MVVGRLIHHIGTVLLLAATAMMVVVSITAPVVNSLAIMRVNLPSSTRGSSITLGTFGYCLLGKNGGHDSCNNPHIGYNPANFISAIEHTDFSSGTINTGKALTNVMVLHPVAAGLSFIAFLFSAAVGICSGLFAAILSALAFIVILVALVCDFIFLALLKSRINGDGKTDAHAKFAVGIWLILASAICTLLATIVVFVTCCASRRKNKRGNYQTSTTTTGRQGKWNNSA